MILDVSSTLGVNDPKFPLRVSTQASGQPGDSGSLITETVRRGTWHRSLGFGAELHVALAQVVRDRFEP